MTPRNPADEDERHAPARKNRPYWDSISDSYQAEHGARLDETALAWGVWRIPEAELNVLGPLAERDVLELGCGAAQWTAALARQGVRVTGIDLSRRQLAHARARFRDGASAPLVLGNAECLPFRDAAFDLVFSDHGATTFARPEHTVAEAARVLRPGGAFAFCMASPLHALCWDAKTDQIGPRLENDYFGLSALEDGESVSYQLPFGAWIRLFRRHALIVEDLVEIQPPEGAVTSYEGFAPLEWARRWPAEHVWKLRKEGARGVTP